MLAVVDRAERLDAAAATRWRQSLLEGVRLERRQGCRAPRVARRWRGHGRVSRERAACRTVGGDRHQVLRVGLLPIHSAIVDVTAAQGSRLTAIAKILIAAIVHTVNLGIIVADGAAHRAAPVVATAAAHLTTLVLILGQVRATAALGTKLVPLHIGVVKVVFAVLLAEVVTEVGWSRTRVRSIPITGVAVEMDLSFDTGLLDSRLGTDGGESHLVLHLV